MAIWWVLFSLAMVSGVGSAVVARVSDRRPKGDGARQVIDSASFGSVWVGLLSGGAVRAIDARIVDFIERGFVRADAGKLVIDSEIELAVASPAVAGGRRPGLGPEDLRLLRVVRDHGGEGLDAVRRRAPTGALRMLFNRLAREGLLVSPLRRAYGPMKVAYPILAAFVPWFAGVLTLGVDSAEDFQGAEALCLLGWFGVPIIAAWIYASKRGYRGPDPATALGVAVVDQLRAELPVDASQARRVALGGFAAMTDEAMRQAVQAHEPDSRWSMPRRRGTDYSVNATVARTAGMLDGGDGDGADGGD
ncbi:hypothetical protein [Phytoactinopolyspora endophytica]|uniref:hypothetical protein n=1 Tax=Phytoactinopolyspora endophytica TaxID=1642495 RepID=UPI00101C65B4|nr:hypothetical protein [Phytoactinopolyspora endophytica]